MGVLARGLLTFLAAMALWVVAQEATASARCETDAAALADEGNSQEEREGEDSENSSEGEEEIDERIDATFADPCPAPTCARIGYSPSDDADSPIPAHVSGIFRPPRLD